MARRGRQWNINGYRGVGWRRECPPRRRFWPFRPVLEACGKPWKRPRNRPNLFMVVSGYPVSYCRPGCRPASSLQRIGARETMGKISAAKLRTLTKPGVHGDGGGLYLQVRDAERRTWIYRYQRPARRAGWDWAASRTCRLPRPEKPLRRPASWFGRMWTLSTQGALQRAETAASAGLNTFVDVARAYIAAHEASWRNAKHRQQWANTLAELRLSGARQAWRRRDWHGRRDPRA